MSGEIREKVAWALAHASQPITPAWAKAHATNSSPILKSSLNMPHSTETGLSPDKPLRIGSHTLTSRLIVGTGKYRSFGDMRDCLEASGSDVITVAVRRERLIDAEGRNILDFIHLDRYTILPNTAGCFTADDAVRVARLGREILSGLENPGADWVKLEVLGDKKTLLPDPIATLQATEALVKDGFQVLVYTTDDPITARRLKEAGAVSVMPAGSPIGSGQGVLNPNNIRICEDEFTWHTNDGINLEQGSGWRKVPHGAAYDRAPFVEDAVSSSPCLGALATNLNRALCWSTSGAIGEA